MDQQAAIPTADMPHEALVAWLRILAHETPDQITTAWWTATRLRDDWEHMYAIGYRDGYQAGQQSWIDATPNILDALSQPMHEGAQAAIDAIKVQAPRYAPEAPGKHA